MGKNKRLIIGVLLVIAIVNYTRIVGTEHVRAVQFLSIFAIGALTALLIREIANQYKSNSSS
jgi:purine-cytosine permease-like protein